ncbi:Protein vav [Eumeta japonica]|uniref:Protein vav n=1 Tax=Eumeta variegata TaxID=151549 RepID=A0A4C1T1C4_EUMVA|nr:Protein vav [Eumeta japonica]
MRPGSKTSIGTESESKVCVAFESKTRPGLKLRSIDMKEEKINSKSMLAQLRALTIWGYLCTACNACAHKECIRLSGRCGGGIAPAPPLPPHNHQPDNALHYYMWYVGEMGRETATARLERRVDGTFLLRVRPQPTHQGDTDTHYALSLKTENTVKHMRVCCKPIDQVPHYFLSESRFFRSVVELVSYYEKTSLGENFVGLNSNLRWPFRRVVATVIHDFRPVEPSQLALRPGAKVLILSKEGDSRGWWKGRTLEKIASAKNLNVLERLTDVNFASSSARCITPPPRRRTSTTTRPPTWCKFRFGRIVIRHAAIDLKMCDKKKGAPIGR